MKLSRHPPGTTTVDSLLDFLYDAYKAKNAQVLQTRILGKLETVKSKVSDSSQEQQWRYKRQFDTEVRSME